MMKLLPDSDFIMKQLHLHTSRLRNLFHCHRRAKLGAGAHAANPLRAEDDTKRARADLLPHLVSLFELPSMANDELVVVVDKLFILRRQA